MQNQNANQNFNNMQKSLKWYVISMNFGLGLFLASLPTMVIGNIIFGGKAWDWAVMILMYPGLILLLGAVGLSDIYKLIKWARLKDLSKESLLGVLLTGVRGIVFIFALIVFIKFEFQIISQLVY